LLAAAGLDRLGRMDLGVRIPIDTMLPAPAQGAVGIEVRSGDARVRDMIGAIDDAATSCCVRHERGLLAALDADCHSPVAALATVDAAHVRLRAMIFTLDGSACVTGEREGSADDETLGNQLAGVLLDQAPPEMRRLFGA
jgi:hydroxymethylbilane synthase